jgi:hypothetical protein
MAHRPFFILTLLWLVLAGCTRTPSPTTQPTDTSAALFNDSDIDKAPLNGADAGAIYADERY